MSSKLHQLFLSSLTLRSIDRSRGQGPSPSLDGADDDKPTGEADPFHPDAVDNIRLVIASAPPLAIDRWENEGGAPRRGTLLRFRRFNPKSGEAHA